MVVLCGEKVLRKFEEIFITNSISKQKKPSNLKYNNQTNKHPLPPTPQKTLKKYQNKKIRAEWLTESV